MSMNILTISLLSIILLIPNQRINCEYAGLITGWDATRCGCCEGWIIEIDGYIYLADSIPDSKKILGPRESLEFPVPIYLEYEREEFCSGKRIIITCIKKR